MRIGYSTWSMKATPYQVVLPRLQEIGYTAIALDVSSGGGRRPRSPNNLATLTDEDRRRIRAQCQERGSRSTP